MKSTLDDNVTRDAFLGGRLHVWQPKNGYRAGIDPVLLAASVNATENHEVLELGCGVGVASLCLAWRTKAKVTGIEIQPEYADLARCNATENKLPFHVVVGDLSVMPAKIKERSFDHVIANPPYYRVNGRTNSQDSGRERALAEENELADWVNAAVRRLKPKGRVTMIQKADRLADILAAFDNRVGDVSVLPIAPRVGKDAELFIIHARKGAKGSFRLLGPLVLHQGDCHHTDGKDYRADIIKILEDGDGLASKFSLHN